MDPKKLRKATKPKFLDLHPATRISRAHADPNSPRKSEYTKLHLRGRRQPTYAGSEEEIRCTATVGSCGTMDQTKRLGCAPESCPGSIPVTRMKGLGLTRLYGMCTARTNGKDESLERVNDRRIKGGQALMAGIFVCENLKCSRSRRHCA
ncbi:uncharacterized protein LOC129299898 [Prosopis cineraria]|uniref:uncharacterized protein LOC129299898 n=1 Tax=Prosopis cineraria TaxID=364024 RepID=UPI00241025BA|nr:uncharacterized protein LOC129299898 [Prosopis cineraria]